MKVVILCGGRGMRLQQETEFKPKPMVEIAEFLMIFPTRIYKKSSSRVFAFYPTVEVGN